MTAKEFFSLKVGDKIASPARPIRYGIGDDYYLDYYQEDGDFVIGANWGENITLEMKDLDRLIEVLQELKGQITR